MDESTTKREFRFVSAPRRSRGINVFADGLACTYLVQQQGDDGRVKNVEINGKAPRAAWITGPLRKPTLNGTRTILLEK